MAATLEELVRGITGAVTREDAKKIAKLHGHPWRRVLKAMKRKARAMPPPALRRAINAAARQVAQLGAEPDWSIVEGIVRHRYHPDTIEAFNDGS